MPDLRDMDWVSAVSERIDTQAAVREAAASLRAAHNRTPDLVLAFVSAHHAASAASLHEWVRDELGETTFVGALTAGVIGAGRELEGREALSLTAAWLPDTTVRALYLADLPQSDTPAVWAEHIGLPHDASPHLLVLAEPQSLDSERLLRGLDAAFPKACKVGGVVHRSEGKVPVLLVGAQAHARGAVLVALDGPFDLTAIVAQGCRPVAEPFIVTRARGNVIQEFNVGKPTEVLRKLYENLDARDHALFDTSLFLGVEMGDKRTSYEAGDFLIRNILGIDQASGAMAIDTPLGEYQVVQFHLRDKDASAQELSQRLRVFGASEPARRVCGALLFSCVGRGERLYGTANHDSDAFRRRVSSVSLSGFFCNGEIGPVSGKTFLHGYTSVFAVFSERAPQAG